MMLSTLFSPIFCQSCYLDKPIGTNVKFISLHKEINYDLCGEISGFENASIDTFQTILGNTFKRVFFILVKQFVIFMTKTKKSGYVECE